MLKSSQAVTCVKCGSLGSADLVPVPVGPPWSKQSKSQTARQCWVCGYEWDEHHPERPHPREYHPREMRLTG